MLAHLSHPRRQRGLSEAHRLAGYPLNHKVHHQYGAKITFLVKIHGHFKLQKIALSWDDITPTIVSLG